MDVVQPVVKGLTTVLLIVWYCLEAFILKFIPSRFLKKKVAGKIALVTGAGNGLGRLVSIQLAKEGCIMVLWDINVDSNKETAAIITEDGGQAFSYTCDLSSQQEIYDTARKVKRDVGNVDILVNNAGIVTGKTFLQCPDSLISKTMDVNINAHFWTCKAFLPTMMDHNSGHIVTIASMAGMVACHGLVDYCASKFAAVGFDESLRLEIYCQGKTGVKTTVVCPIFINTGMFDGVQTRSPLLMPILESDYVANEIVKGILTNREVVILPPVVAFSLVLKSMMPAKASLLMAKYLGVGSAMENFRGRPKFE